VVFVCGAASQDPLSLPSILIYSQVDYPKQTILLSKLEVFKLELCIFCLTPKLIHFGGRQTLFFCVSSSLLAALLCIIDAYYLLSIVWI
jgi:hypothetical protein